MNKWFLIAAISLPLAIFPPTSAEARNKVRIGGNVVVDEGTDSTNIRELLASVMDIDYFVRYMAVDRGIMNFDGWVRRRGGFAMPPPEASSPGSSSACERPCERAIAERCSSSTRSMPELGAGRPAAWASGCGASAAGTRSASTGAR